MEARAAGPVGGQQMAGRPIGRTPRAIHRWRLAVHDGQGRCAGLHQPRERVAVPGACERDLGRGLSELDRHAHVERPDQPDDRRQQNASHGHWRHDGFRGNGATGATAANITAPAIQTGGTATSVKYLASGVVNCGAGCIVTGASFQPTYPVCNTGEPTVGYDMAGHAQRRFIRRLTKSAHPKFSTHHTLLECIQKSLQKISKKGPRVYGYLIRLCAVGRDRTPELALGRPPAEVDATSSMADQRARRAARLVAQGRPRSIDRTNGPRRASFNLRPKSINVLNPCGATKRPNCIGRPASFSKFRRASSGDYAASLARLPGFAVARNGAVERMKFSRTE